MVPDPKALLLHRDGATYRIAEHGDRGEVFSVLETKDTVGGTQVLREIRLDLPGLPDVPWLRYSPGRRASAVRMAKKAGASAAAQAAMWMSRQSARNGVHSVQGVIYRTTPVDVREPSALARLTKGGLTVGMMWKDLKDFARRPVEGYYTKDHTLVVLGRIRTTDLKERYELL